MYLVVKSMILYLKHFHIHHLLNLARLGPPEFETEGKTKQNKMLSFLVNSGIKALFIPQYGLAANLQHHCNTRCVCFLSRFHPNYQNDNTTFW